MCVIEEGLAVEQPRPAALAPPHDRRCLRAGASDVARDDEQPSPLRVPQTPVTPQGEQRELVLGTLPLPTRKEKRGPGSARRAESLLDVVSRKQGWMSTGGGGAGVRGAAGGLGVASG